MQNKIPSLVKNFDAINTFNFHIKKAFSNAIKMTKLGNIYNLDRIKMQDALLSENDNGVRLDIQEPSEFLIQDVEPNKRNESGQILAFNFLNKDINLFHGDYGIPTSKKHPNPKDLLKHKVIIPKCSFSAINLRKNTAFLPEIYKDLFLIGNPGQIYKIPPFKEKIEQCSMTPVVNFLPEVAESVHSEIKNQILRDPKNNEKFNGGTKKDIINPTNYLKSSQTLMDFSEKQEETTAMHFHPGERELIIFTTDKPAGVVLNFCGINDNPDEHPECERKFEFPKNSMVVLKFPPYTHHKFTGSFVCTSVHPREGENFIKAVQTGNIKGGFLESATVMSKMGKNAKVVEAPNDSKKVSWKNDYLSKNVTQKSGVTL